MYSKYSSKVMWLWADVLADEEEDEAPAVVEVFAGTVVVVAAADVEVPVAVVEVPVADVEEAFALLPVVVVEVVIVADEPLGLAVGSGSVLGC